MPWRFPAEPDITLPVAVTLKRFLALDLVFILGISISYLSKWSLRATRQPILAGQHLNRMAPYRVVLRAMQAFRPVNRRMKHIHSLIEKSNTRYAVN